MKYTQERERPTYDTTPLKETHQQEDGHGRQKGFSKRRDCPVDDPILVLSSPTGAEEMPYFVGIGP